MGFHLGYDKNDPQATLAATVGMVTLAKSLKAIMVRLKFKHHEIATQALSHN